MSDVAVCKATARALEIFCLFRFEVKVGCHKGSVEFDREPQGLKPHRMIATDAALEAPLFHEVDRLQGGSKTQGKDRWAREAKQFAERLDSRGLRG